MSRSGRKNLRDDEITYMLALYRNGVPMKVISDECKVTFSTINNWARFYKLPKRYEPKDKQYSFFE